MNPTTHGLTAWNPLLPGEDPEEYRTLRAEIAAAENPQDAVDELLVDEVTDCVWRLRRAPGLEASILVHHETNEIECEVRAEALGCPLNPEVFGGAFIRDTAGPNAILKLTKYETALANRRDRALRALERRRASRTESAQTRISKEGQLSER